MNPSLPQRLAEKTILFPGSSYGANRVTLVLADGRRVHEVFIAGRAEIVKIGTRLVSRPEDLDFRVADIADVISEVK